MTTQEGMATPGSAHWNENEKSRPSRSFLGKWLHFGLCIMAFWLLVFVVLPLGQRLPLVKPVMGVIKESGVDVSAYFYTQSEETAYAVMFVNSTVNGVKGPVPK